MYTHTVNFDAIGTSWAVEMNLKSGKHDFSKIKDEIQARIETFDKTYSRFRSDSLVHEVSNSPGTYTFPEDAQPLFSTYEKLYELTAGKVTPLVGKLLSDAGYDAQYSLTPTEELVASPIWADVMRYDHPHLETRRPLLLDFGASGKGYLVDIVGELLNQESVGSYFIDAGGDMLRKHPASDLARVGLEHPADPSQAIGVANLGNGSICGSATNRRTWAGLHHIVDPHTTKPVHEIVATWVMAKSAMLADGIATALFFVDPNKLSGTYSFEYCVVKEDLSFVCSKDFPAEIFVGAKS